MPDAVLSSVSKLPESGKISEKISWSWLVYSRECGLPSSSVWSFVSLVPVVLRFLGFIQRMMMKYKQRLGPFLLCTWSSGRSWYAFALDHGGIPVVWWCVTPILRLGTLNPGRVSNQAELGIWTHVWRVLNNVSTNPSSELMELCFSGNIWGLLREYCLGGGR